MQTTSESSPPVIPVRCVPTTSKEHHRCFPLRLGHTLRPVIAAQPSPTEHWYDPEREDRQRHEVEAFILTRVYDYCREKPIRYLRFTSLSRIRHRLGRDLERFSERYAPNSVSERKRIQWLDDALRRIDSQLKSTYSLCRSPADLKQSLSAEHFFASKNANNQWTQLQMKRARDVLATTQNEGEDLLSEYRNYVLQTLTPDRSTAGGVSLVNDAVLDLDVKYGEAERIGREHLERMFADYRTRQRPNLALLKEMIAHGMKQMPTQPKTDELQKAASSSNFLLKIKILSQRKDAYSMSLKNIADDFMFLRFGRSLSKDNAERDSISERFTSLIHTFLRTVSILVQTIRSDPSEPIPFEFLQFDPDLPSEDLLSPLTHVDQWTWLLEKWKASLQTFPIHLTRSGAFARLVRTTVGVGIARLFGFAENNEHDGLDGKFFQALQMGFYYGIAYALVDGLQDTRGEQPPSIDVDRCLIEMERVLCGCELNPASLPQLPITPLLLETFRSLSQLASMNAIAREIFTDLALLLRSQRADKKEKRTIFEHDVDLYLGALMKAHFTYTVTAFMGGARIVEQDPSLWTMPFLGQLTDDCRDFDEDRRDQSVTPVTYYAQHSDPPVLNPFFVFLYVCEDLYLQSQREANTGAFLGRRVIRTLRSLQHDLNEFLIVFTARSDPDLYKYTLSLEKLFDRVSDPEKSLFRRLNKSAVHYAVHHRKLQTFAFDHLPCIEKQLSIDAHTDDPILVGMNHSLRAGGKRLRPLLLLMVAQLYDIEFTRILPLATAIEYLHTSSLIFDDLPAQDNAPLRRGQPTLHTPIGSDTDAVPATLAEGRAQLVAVDMIAHAIRLVTVDLHRQGFSYESINQVTAELSQSMDALCHGQFLDLQAARTRKSFTIDELDRVAELKTGKAIEIALVCPVLLARQGSTVPVALERLRELGKLMGILYQMKDDLLDVEGQIDQLGKLPKIDAQNGTVTYVSLLGAEGTRRRIADKRREAERILKDLWPQAGTLRDVVQHICERTK